MLRCLLCHLHLRRLRLGLGLRLLVLRRIAVIPLLRGLLLLLLRHHVLLLLLRHNLLLLHLRLGLRGSLGLSLGLSLRCLSSLHVGARLAGPRGDLRGQRERGRGRRSGRRERHGHEGSALREVVVFHRLVRVEAARGLELQHVLDELNSGAGCFGDDDVQGLLGVFGEGCFDLNLGLRG